MLTSRFFWKVYASCATVVVLTTAAIGWWSRGELVEALLREKEGSLRQECARLTDASAKAFAQPLDGAPSRVPSGHDFGAPSAWRDLAASGLRITLIRTDGQVHFDSRHALSSMENHLDREEVQEALGTGRGSAVRTSRTDGHRTFYVSQVVAAPEGEPLGVLRLALPMDAIDRQTGAMRARLALAATLALLVALAGLALVHRRWTRPLAQITSVARDLCEGRYDRRAGKLPDDEVGELGNAINRLGGEITQRMKALSGEVARLRAMLAGMVEGVVAVDQDDRVVFSNRAARRLFGVEELAGRLWESVRIAELVALIEEARGTDAAATRELTFGDPAGRYSCVQAQAHRFRSGASTGVVVVLHDLTELRRLERVRRDFVANVSHELKTPLTSIRGYVETLLSGALHDEDNNVRFLEKIDSNVRRLTHLVADLLSLARIESQETGLPLEPLDLRPLLEQALRQHGPRAVQKGVRCSIEPDGGRVRVLGDRESLVQVIDNLLDNAIKYTSRGEVRLVLRRDASWGMLEVVDTGIGIPAEERERVFERFYRVDRARSRELGGTGLGLSIVKHLVVAMNGLVEVESNMGRGSTFRVRLPLAEPGA